MEDEPFPPGFREARSRIMYIEDESEVIKGPAKIGSVCFSKSGRTLYYREQRSRSLKGSARC